VPTTKDERIQVGQPGYVIAGTSNNKPLAGAPSFASEAHAHDYLNEQLLKKPGMADEIHVIPSFEATTV
jgi:hypothetical protein